MYGAQTRFLHYVRYHRFENDVEMYGAQTIMAVSPTRQWFENDVEMYGAQTMAICFMMNNAV